MSKVELAAQEKKIKKRNPVSKELSATKSYALQLSKVYGKHISLCFDAVYKGPASKMSFLCDLCQGVTTAKASTMLKGSGCRECRTSAIQMLDLNEHKHELETTTFRLKADPVTFNRNSKYYYGCRKCHNQIYVRPQNALNTICNVCEQLGEKKNLVQMYKTRLDSLYAKTIQRVGEFSLTHPTLHVCSNHPAPYSWFALCADLLHGKGCPMCSPVAIKVLDPVSVSNKKFELRSALEIRMLKALKNDGYKMSDVMGRLEYPIPITHGRHSPPLYVKSTHTVYDVFKDVKKLEGRLKRILRTRDLLKQFGLKYVIAVAMEGTIMFKQTDDIKSKKKPKPIIKTVEIVAERNAGWDDDSPFS